MPNEPMVWIVDDDEALRTSLQRLLASVEISSEAYSSADEFLHRYNAERGGCLILDIRMPGMSGLDLQDELVRMNIDIPTIIISGHADVRAVVRAMRTGAVDVLEKPYHPQDLIDQVHAALERDARLRARQQKRELNEARLARLTPREKEVARELIAGLSVKEIASKFGLSHKTVHVHRARILEKTRSRSPVDLVHLSLADDASFGVPDPATANSHAAPE